MPARLRNYVDTVRNGDKRLSEPFYNVFKQSHSGCSRKREDKRIQKKLFQQNVSDQSQQREPPWIPILTMVAGRVEAPKTLLFWFQAMREMIFIYWNNEQYLTYDALESLFVVVQVAVFSYHNCYSFVWIRLVWRGGVFETGTRHLLRRSEVLATLWNAVFSGWILLIFTERKLIKACVVLILRHVVYNFNDGPIKPNLKKYCDAKESVRAKA